MGVVRVCAAGEIVFGCVLWVRIAKCGRMRGVLCDGAKGLRRNRGVSDGVFKSVREGLGEREKGVAGPRGRAAVWPHVVVWGASGVCVGRRW